MKLTRRRLTTFFLWSLFIFSLICFFSRVIGAFSTTVYQAKEISQHLQDDEFDISLLRLNSMGKLQAYCDSIYAANYPKRTYPGIVSEVIRNRFYHGYSYYSTKTNPMAVVFAPLVKKGADAIVIPNDIIQYPMAACSQQSIVGMELFKRKGYNVRKVSMFDSLTQTGHFSYEVFYDNGWHYFDTDQEPDASLLKEYNRPSVAFLARHPEIVAQAYRKKKDPAMFQRLIESYSTGPVNKFPAPNGRLFQETTKLLTYFGWAILWLLIWVRYRIHAVKPLLFFASAKKEAILKRLRYRMASLFLS
jgi:hypothetical protein